MPALSVLCGCRRTQPEPTPAIPSAPQLPAPPPSTAGEGAITPRLIALPPPGGSLSAPTWSPSGDALAFCSFVEDPQQQCAHTSIHLYTCAASAEPLTTLLSRTATPGVFHRFESPSWSPDGKSLAVTELVGPYASEGGFVGWLIPRNGGEPRSLPYDTGATAWSPEGRWLALLRGDQSDDTFRCFVDRWSPRPGEPTRRLVAPGQFDFIDNLSWSPTGDRLVLIASRHNTAVVAVVDVPPSANATDRIKPAQVIASLGDRFSYGSPVLWAPDGNRILLADNDTLLSVDLTTQTVSRRSYPGDIVGYTPDGSAVAVLVEDQLDVLLEGEDQPQPILDLEDVDEHPVEAAFSPDLSQLAITAEGKLWLCQFARG